MRRSSGTRGTKRPKRYSITIRGELSERFAGWFEGMVLNSEDGNTVLTGTLDQAQLYGVLERIQDLGLEFLSVTQISEDTPAPPLETKES